MDLLRPLALETGGLWLSVKPLLAPIDATGWDYIDGNELFFNSFQSLILKLMVLVDES